MDAGTSNSCLIATVEHFRLVEFESSELSHSQKGETHELKTTFYYFHDGCVYDTRSDGDAITNSAANVHGYLRLELCRHCTSCRLAQVTFKPHNEKTREKPCTGA